MNTSDNALEFENVAKTYEGNVEALSSISFNVRPGEIFALLGPNGAGKSTLIHILTGIVQKTSGRVCVMGSDIDTDTINAKRKIGLVPQELSFDPFFTSRELLSLTRGYFGLAPDKEYEEELLDIFALTPHANKKARHLSGGMRRRLLIARALVHKPEVLILDEPTAGVDVDLRQNLWKAVRNFKAQGTTILLTTHYIEEAEDLSDRTCILSHGRVLALDDTQKLIDQMGRDRTLEITLNQKLESIPDELKPWKPRLKGNSICLSYAAGKVGDLLAQVSGRGWSIDDIKIHKDDLEDVFLKLTREHDEVVAGNGSE